jgi:phage-related protein
MADNVNKMGTSMEAVQNAYRGFSRGNFTMLDNLALGYSGTKEGMEELLAEAERVQAANGNMVDYSIDSYADMVEAIHVVQEEMGITGTTSREASETIQGSLSATKSAWENLIAGIADPEADLGSLVGNLVDTAETALDNIIPAAERAFGGIGEVAGAMIPAIAERVPELIEAGGALVKGLGDGIATAVSNFSFKDDVVPLIVKFAAGIRQNAKGLVSAGADLIKGLADGIGDNSSYILITAHQIFASLFGVFMDNAPVILKLCVQLIENLGQGIAENLPTLLENVLPMIEQFSETFRKGAGQLVDVGIDFILNLVQGIMDSLPTLIEQVPQIIINFAGAINDNAPKLLVGGVQLIVTIVQGIISAIPTLVANIPKIFEAILAVWTALNWINLGKNVIEFIKNGIEQLSTNLPQALKDIGNKAIEWFKGVDWANAGTQAIDFIKSAILGVATKVPETVLDIANKAWEWFNDVDWYSLGSNIIDGIVNGLNSGIGWLKEKAMSVAEDALNAAKNFLDINSPSRKFRDEVGKMIPAGIAVGIDDAAIKAIESADKLSKSIFKPFDDLEAPVISPTVETAYTGAYQADIATLIAQAIAANNEALIDRMYEAMLMAMQDGGFGIQLDGREVGRMMRESGVVMA